MTPTATTRHGKPCWTIDARGSGMGRIFGPTKDSVLVKLRKKLGGVDKVEFTDQDRLAKQEIGESGTLLDAVRFYLAHKPNSVRKPLAEAISECVAAKAKRNRRPAYLTHLRVILTQFKTFAGDVQCSEINTSHINRFLESRPWAGSTRAGMRTRLSAFFSQCVKQGWCTLNPVDAVETESVEKTRPKILTVEQVHRLLDTAQVLDPALLNYFVLGLFCGIRPEELRRLPVSAIKLAHGVVDIPPHVSKTRDRRLVELSANARTWLHLVPKVKAESTVFVSRKRRRAVCDWAHVTWSPDVMRHTFASYHIEKHQSADKTALELGHQGSTKMLFRHYKATVTPEDAAAFWQLEPVPMLTIVKEKAVNE